MFHCLSGSRTPPCCRPLQVLQPIPRQVQVLHDRQCPNLHPSATSVCLRFSKWPVLPAWFVGVRYSWALSSRYLGEAQTSGLERRAHTTKYLNICKLPLCVLLGVWLLHCGWAVTAHDKRGFNYVPHSYWETSTSGANPISAHIRWLDKFQELSCSEMKAHTKSFLWFRLFPLKKE